MNDKDPAQARRTAVLATGKRTEKHKAMNEDTDMLYEGLANDEFLYRECERAASFAGMTAKTEDEFIDLLADSLAEIAERNRDIIPGFSNSEPIEYENVDYDEIAREYKYADYRMPEDDG